MSITRKLNTIFIVMIMLMTNISMVSSTEPVVQTVGSIWTTLDSCGDPQNVNEYGPGDWVYINGEGFTASTTLSWDITGKPGACDADIAVAIDSIVTDANGAFCFKAYQINTDDCGIYSANVDGKNDNYGVGCVDRDEDGFDLYNAYSCTGGTDCDDSDPLVFGGIEICGDGIDNDCNGLIDCDDDECLFDVTCDMPPECTEDSECGIDSYACGTMEVLGIQTSGLILTDYYCTDLGSCHFHQELDDCDDGDQCTIDSCDADECLNVYDETLPGCELPDCEVDADCDNGLYCDGTETCDYDGTCLPGTPPFCMVSGPYCSDDYSAVLINSNLCDEDLDMCVQTPEVMEDCYVDPTPFCDDGLTSVIQESGSCSDDDGAHCVVSSSISMCYDGDPCTADSCSAGECVFPDNGVCIQDYSCGDGEVNNLSEECDDGNNINGDGCSADCIVEYCGDGIVNNNDEECENTSVCDESILENDICYFDASCTDCGCGFDNDELCPLPGTEVENVCYYGTQDCTANGCGLLEEEMICQDTCDSVLGALDTTGPITSGLDNTPLIPLYQGSEVYETTLVALETEDCTDIIAAEYFIDKNVVTMLPECNDDTARGTAMEVTDGSWDSTIEDVEALLEFNPGDDGAWMVCVRGQNEDGYWGECECLELDVDTLPPDYPQDVTIDPYMCNQNRTITATVCDSETPIESGIFYLDEISWDTFYPMSVTDEVADELCEEINGTLDVTDVDDGCHQVMIRGKDIAGNWGKIYYSGEWAFILDKTAPKTEKEMTGPVIECDNITTDGDGNELNWGCYYMKSNSVAIILEGADDQSDVVEAECRAETFETYYQIRWKLDWDDVWPEWSNAEVYNGAIMFEEDSLHEIRFWSEDSCGNIENMNYELDIVDTQAPELIKTIDGPQFDHPDERIHKFLNSDSVITLECVDKAPHPVGGEVLEWKMFWSYDDLDSWDLLAEGTESEDAIKVFDDLDNSYHKFEYRCSDALGNTGEWITEIDAVDNQAPVITKDVHERKVLCDDVEQEKKPGFILTDEPDENECWYVTQETPITLTCVDEGPHEVDNIVMTYSWSWESDVAEGNSKVYETTDEVVNFSYTEDSWHELTVTCVDALGNEATFYEDDIVDTQAPETEIDVTGPVHEVDNMVFIDNDSRVVLTCEDTLPHPVGEDFIMWRYFVTEDAGADAVMIQDWEVYNGAIWFPEESMHDMEYYCVDRLGNEEDVQDARFFVDHTPPTTTLDIGTPYVTNGTSEWIDVDTSMTLSADDGDNIHDSGVADTFLRITRVADLNCVEECSVDGDGEFEVYNGAFVVGEESCHLIEYYSVDNVEKTEDVNKRCIFVDDTAPKTTKEVSQPKFDIQNGYNADWYINDETEITLTCDDQDPHPVGGETIYWAWRWSYEGDVWTDWSDAEVYNGAISFDESSLHEIKYWCVDALGNTEKTNFEIDVVDLDAPESWKEVGKPRVPIPADEVYNAAFTDEGYWVTEDTLITLGCEDVLPHPVGDVEIWFRVLLDGNLQYDWTEYEGSFTLDDDSNHTLEWFCVDALGNYEETRSELDRVDTAPPEVDKFVIKDGEEFFSGEEMVTIAVQPGEVLNMCAYVHDVKTTGEDGVGVSDVVGLLENYGSFNMNHIEGDLYCAEVIVLDDCGTYHYSVKATDLLENEGDWENGIEIFVDGVPPVGMVLNPHAGRDYYAGKIFKFYADAVDFGGSSIDDCCDGGWCNEAEEDCEAVGVDYCDLYAVDYPFEDMDQSEIGECTEDLLLYLVQTGIIDELPEVCEDLDGRFSMFKKWACREALLDSLMDVSDVDTPYVEYIGRVPYEDGVCNGYAQIAEDTQLTDTVFLAWELVDKAGNGEGVIKLALNPGAPESLLFNQPYCGLELDGTLITMNIEEMGTVIIGEWFDDPVTSNDILEMTATLSESGVSGTKECRGIITDDEDNMIISYDGIITGNVITGYECTIQGALPDYSEIDSGIYTYTIEYRINDDLQIEPLPVQEIGSDWHDFEVDNTRPDMGLISPKENGIYGAELPISLYIGDEGAGVATDSVKVRVTEPGNLANLWCVLGCEDTGWLALDDIGNDLYTTIINLADYDFTEGDFVFDAIACDELYQPDNDPVNPIGLDMNLDRNAMHCRMISVHGVEEEERTDCNNGLDDDGDDLIDYLSDDGCESIDDETEFCDPGVLTCVACNNWGNCDVLSDGCTPTEVDNISGYSECQMLV